MNGFVIQFSTYFDALFVQTTNPTICMDDAAVHVKSFHTICTSIMLV